MANKVLSIKMDENDIEKLKKYYKALVDTGYLSAETMSLNAFYKHLLLDYLDDDLNRAFATFADYGVASQWLNPDKLDIEEEGTIANTYNLSKEMFENYKKCAKEALCRSIDEMKENVKILNEIVDSNVIIKNGFLCEMECVSLMDIDEKKETFWERKALEMVEYQENKYRELDGEIEMIENSSISDELKQQLINEIREYEKKRKQNYSILQGRGINK